MACFGLVTFFPLRPDLSLPCFMARISRSTSLPAEGEYLRPEDFFDLLELDFFDAEPRVLFFELLLRVLFFAPLLRVLFFALPREEREREEALLELELDFFLAAFFVAILSSSEVRWRAAWGKLHAKARGGLPGDARAVAIVVTRRGEFLECARADRRGAMLRRRRLFQ